MKLTSTFILFLIPFAIAAQTNFQFLPINENSKWGFIDINGNELIAPQFDAYTIKKKRKSYHNVFDYVIVEKNNKIGIVDTNGILVLPTIYEDVEVSDINPLQFKVKTKEGIFPVDSAGMRLIDTPYDDLHLITNHYYAVRKGKKWGIHEVNGKQILPCEYYGFDLAYSTSMRKYVDGYFIYRGNKEGTQNGLLNLNKEIVLPPIYDTINIINDQIISASLTSNEAHLYTTSGDSLGITFQEFGRLMEGFIVLYKKEKGETTLFNLKTLKEFKPKGNCYNYSYFSRKYIKVLSTNWQVIDTLGNVVLKENYEAIKVFADSLFLMKKYISGKLGIVKIGDSIVLNNEYDRIMELNKDGFAIIYKNDKQGLINAKAEIILPAEYDKIENIKPQNRHLLIEDLEDDSTPLLYS